MKERQPFRTMTSLAVLFLASRANHDTARNARVEMSLLLPFSESMKASHVRKYPVTSGYRNSGPSTLLIEPMTAPQSGPHSS